MSHCHACLRCGRDLARTRAAREPHYGWWIVRCPECAAVAVRRRHPAGQWWRWMLRVGSVTSTLIVRTVTGVLLILATAAAVDHLLMEVLLGVSPFHTWSMLQTEAGRARARLSTAVIIFPICLGLWIALGPEHWRRGIATVLCVLAVALTRVMVLAEDPRGEYLSSVIIAIALVPFMAVGLVPGSVLHRLSARLRRRRTRWIRRMARRGRFIPG